MRKDMRVLSPLLVVLIIIFLAGCGNSSNSNSIDLAPLEENKAPSSQSGEETSPLKISYKVYRETFRDDDGTELVNFRFIYPYIDNPDNAQGIAAINDYYEAQLDHFIKTVIPEGKEAALEFKKVAQENGFDFYSLAFEREPSIYYNGNNLLSVLNLDFENTGGAHPNSYWSSETFDVETGRMLTLADIFGLSREESLGKVYEIVINQIEQAKSKDDYGEDVYYFDEYEENAKNYYSENDFVLGPKGIIFYYQLYTLAPYAAGFPTFDLPYDEAGNLAIEILPLKSNEHERNAYLQAGRLIEANREVFCNIFGLSMLPLEIPENLPEDQSVFPVKDNRFVTFSDLENFIRGIYVKSEADALMNSGRYIDKDGKLYGDINKDAGMGYYVDWNNYRYELSDISESKATITIYTVDDSPAGKEDITIKVNMLKENDHWLLEKMFS